MKKATLNNKNIKNLKKFISFSEKEKEYENLESIISNEIVENLENFSPSTEGENKILKEILFDIKKYGIKTLVNFDLYYIKINLSYKITIQEWRNVLDNLVVPDFELVFDQDNFWWNY